MKNSTVRFLVFTFGISWIIWIPVAFVVPRYNPPMAILVPVVIFGAFAPSIVGSVMGGIFAPRAERRDFWSRAFDPRRISWKWWAFILVLYPAIALVSAGANGLLGGESMTLDPTVLASPGAFVGFLVFMLLGGPLAEELGWRGYLIDRLFARWNVMTSTLIIAVIWVIWHAPLFFIEGTAQHAQGMWTIKGLQWTVEVFCIAVIVSVVYVNTNRSSLGAVLLHFMSNSTFTILAGSEYTLSTQFGVVNTILHVVIAAVILLVVDTKNFRLPRTGRAVGGAN